MNHQEKHPSGVKRCRTCGLEKSLTEYYRNAGKPDGRSTYCRVCELKYTKTWQKANPQKMNKYDYYISIIKAKYGISKEEYEKLVLSHEDKCAICRQPASGKKKRLHIDHDHSTGKVRGLLCFNCNRVLGVFRDSEERLQRAIDYLKKYK